MKERPAFVNLVLSTAELIQAVGRQVQVDNASALQALVGDKELTRYKIAVNQAREKHKMETQLQRK